MRVYLSEIFITGTCPTEGCIACKIPCKEKGFFMLKYLLKGASTGSPQLNKALDILKAHDEVYITKIAKNNTRVNKKVGATCYVFTGYMIIPRSLVYTEFTIKYYKELNKVSVDMFLEDDNVCA